MKKFAVTIAAAGLALGAAVPALAQETMVDPETLTCADFTAMQPEQQAMAVMALKQASSASGTTTTGSATTGSDTATTGSDASGGTATTGTDTTGTAGTDTTGTAGTDTTGTAGTSTDTTGTAGAATDPDVTALMTACAGQDDKLAKDAMSGM